MSITMWTSSKKKQQIISDVVAELKDNHPDEHGIFFHEFPKPAGQWNLHGFAFQVMKKPNWFHRKMHKLLLGWDWQDTEENYP